VLFNTQYKKILSSVNNRQYSCGIFTIPDGNGHEIGAVHIVLEGIFGETQK